MDTIKEQGWRRLTRITNNKIEKLRINFSETV